MYGAMGRRVDMMWEPGSAGQCLSGEEQCVGSLQTNFQGQQQQNISPHIINTLQIITSKLELADKCLFLALN